MKVLIVGGSGQVGTALRESAPDGVLIQAPTSTQLDVCSRESAAAAIAAGRPDLVVNAAAYTQVERAEEEGNLALQVNGSGAGHVAAACAAVGCALIHLSTDYVFDGRQQRPYREEDTPAPLNAYGRSKLAGERAVREILERHLILRASWVFSATGSNFVKTMLDLADSEELRVVDDQHGTPCAASSIAAAIWQLAGRLDATRRYGTYHFASTPATTWYEFAREVFSLLRASNAQAKTPVLVPITTSERPTRAERPANSLLDAARLHDDYGIAPPHWRSDLRSVIDRLLAV